MKKSRKLLAILLTVALALSSAACSGGGRLPGLWGILGNTGELSGSDGKLPGF